MIIYGISFRIHQNDPHILTEILQGVDIDNYLWNNELSQEETYIRDEKGSIIDESLFGKQFYNGKEFSNQIRKPHFVLSLKLGAYKNNVENKIHSYRDFELSDCELLFLIYDCEFVEIYIKQPDYVNIIINNCMKNGFNNIELISKKTRRTSNMDVR